MDDGIRSPKVRHGNSHYVKKRLRKHGRFHRVCLFQCARTLALPLKNEKITSSQPFNNEFRKITRKIYFIGVFITALKSKNTASITF